MQREGRRFLRERERQRGERGREERERGHFAFFQTKKASFIRERQLGKAPRQIVSGGGTHMIHLKRSVQPSIILMIPLLRLRSQTTHTKRSDSNNASYFNNSNNRISYNNSSSSSISSNTPFMEMTHRPFERTLAVSYATHR